MTQDEARRLQNLCDEVIEHITANRPEPRPNWIVNWADISCSDVLVSALNPNDPPTLLTEEASPNAWGFAMAVADEIEKRCGLKVTVRTEW